MHVVIIGNGIAGITTARTLRKNDPDVSITVISSESKYFYSRTALMYIYMGHMKYEHTKPYEDWFWDKNRIDLCFDHVDGIDFNEKKLTLRSAAQLSYDKLVIATGSVSKRFDWPGQDLNGVLSLYGLQDLEILERHSKGLTTAVIVGGGLIGIELAEMLRTRNVQVTYLVREPYFWSGVLPPQEGKMITDHIVRDHHIDLRCNSELDCIIGDENGNVLAVKDKAGNEIPCQLVGLTVGVRPNIDFLKDSKLEIDKGILVNEYLETNLPEVYACGDCAQLRVPASSRKALEQVWYTGRMMGECLGATLSGRQTPYLPGIWFNSAKFFDIEYQTYGNVPSILSDYQTDFYWQHPHKKQAVHFVYHRNTHALLGVNAFGIRLRHAVLEQWILRNRNMDYVLTHLRDVWFEPELHEDLTLSIVRAYNLEHGTNIKLLKMSWKRLLNHLKIGANGN